MIERTRAGYCRDCNAFAGLYPIHRIEVCLPCYVGRARTQKREEMPREYDERKDPALTVPHKLERKNPAPGFWTDDRTRLFIRLLSTEEVRDDEGGNDR